MSYSSIVEMTQSPALQARIAACAADEGYTGDPQLWARNNIWAVASSTGWVAAWDYARGTPNQENYNPDTGAREDVIDDDMIREVVAPMVNPPPPPVIDNTLPGDLPSESEPKRAAKGKR